MWPVLFGGAEGNNQDWLETIHLKKGELSELRHVERCFPYDRAPRRT